MEAEHDALMKGAWNVANKPSAKGFEVMFVHGIAVHNGDLKRMTCQLWWLLCIRQGLVTAARGPLCPKTGEGVEVGMGANAAMTIFTDFEPKALGTVLLRETNEHRSGSEPNGVFDQLGGGLLKQHGVEPNGLRPNVVVLYLDLNVFLASKVLQLLDDCV